MTKYGRLIVNTRPINLEIYLDGQPVLDYLGKIARSPTMILNVSAGIHSATFSKDGYNTTTVMTNVRAGHDSDVKAILSTSHIRYPMMLSQQDQNVESYQYIEPLQPKQMGTVRFDSDPHGANIYVDGQILTDPETEESLKTPVHTLLYEGRRDYTIRLQGYEDGSGYVDVYPGTTVNVYKKLKQG